MENLISPELSRLIINAGIAVEIVGVIAIVVGALWASLKDYIVKLMSCKWLVNHVILKLQLKKEKTT